MIILNIILFCLLFIKIGYCTRQGVYKLPFRKHTTLRNNTLGNSVFKNIGGYAEPLFHRVVYTATVTIGMPGQEFNLLIDTGSSDTWVVNKFDASQSISFLPTFQQFHVGYADRSQYEGSVGMDLFRFGPSNDLTALAVPNTLFGIATATDLRENAGIDGILGMGFPELSEAGMIPPIFNAFQQHLLPFNLFTVYLKAIDGNTSGELSIGYIDTEHCQPVQEWIPLDFNNRIGPNGYWQFDIQDLNYGNNIIYSGIMDAISDTGTALIRGPPELVDAIVANLGVNMYFDDGIFTIPCNFEYAPIGFVIGGKVYWLEREFLTIPVLDQFRNDGSYNPVGNHWVLGDPFIRKFCQIHDYGFRRIAFAEAKHQMIQK